MGIPNQVERLAEIEALISELPPSPELLHLIERWWVRVRPDGVVCKRCVFLKEYCKQQKRDK